MAGLTSLPCVVFILPLLSSYAEGQFQVICPAEPIVAVVGEDVILTCHVEPQLNVAGMTLDWSKLDFQSDPNNSKKQLEFVYVYRDRQELPAEKFPAYIGRTALITDGLRHGNISLKIINVTMADKGQYKCHIPKLEGREKSAIVHLDVLPNKPSTTETLLQPGDVQSPNLMKDTTDSDGLSRNDPGITTVYAPLLVLLVPSIGAAVFVIRCLKKKRNNQQFLNNISLKSIWMKITRGVRAVPTEISEDVPEMAPM